MKKTLSLILALVLCLSLCACGGTNSTKETLSKNELQYVGTWVCDNTGDDWMRVLRLYSDRRALWHDAETTDDVGLSNHLNQYGTWDVRDGAIIFYSSGDNYVVFTVKDNNTIVEGDETYTRTGN